MQITAASQLRVQPAPNTCFKAYFQRMNLIKSIFYRSGEALSPSWLRADLKSHFLMTQETRQKHSAGTAGQESDYSHEDGKIRQDLHWSSQEMHLIDIFGKGFSFSYADIFRLLSNRLMVGMLMLNAAVLFAVDPHGYRGHMTGAWSLAIWVGSTFFLIAIRLTSYAVVGLIQARGIMRRLYVPALSIFEYGLVFYAVAQVSYLLAHDNYQFDFSASFPYLLFVFLMLEAFFIRFVVPDTVKRNSGMAVEPVEMAVPAFVAEVADEPAQKTDAPPNTYMAVGERKIRFEHLLWLNSEEHYVHIKTRHETLTVRAKLPDLLNQLPQYLGVRCHRSWWVSRVARPKIEKCEQGLCLVCEAGCQAPIARSRKKAVQEWVDLNRDW